VSGRANNITGRYPSPKMGMSIQFESDRVEFWAIYTMERDDDILEFYDQSSRISLWGPDIFTPIRTNLRIAGFLVGKKATIIRVLH